MWRQVFVICLLLTLSEFWAGVNATHERYDIENSDDEINQYSRSNYEKANGIQVDAQRNPDATIQGGDIKSGELAADVQEPDSPPSSGTGGSTDTGGSTQKNETQTSVHHPPQPLEGGRGKIHTPNQSMFSDSSSLIFIVTVAACSVAGLVGIIMAGVCWYKLNRSAKAASDVEYPAYGVTGPNKERIPSPGDRKLAQSAQMYHYQHQKQQMIAMEKANGEMKHDASDEESEEENEEGDYTVYECPGLAPTGEMEVKNPLFSDETPVTPSAGDDKKDVN